MILRHVVRTGPRSARRQSCLCDSDPLSLFFGFPAGVETLSLSERDPACTGPGCGGCRLWGLFLQPLNDCAGCGALKVSSVFHVLSLSPGVIGVERVGPLMSCFSPLMGGSLEISTTPAFPHECVGGCGSLRPVPPGSFRQLPNGGLANGNSYRIAFSTRPGVHQLETNLIEHQPACDQVHSGMVLLGSCVSWRPSLVECHLAHCWQKPKKPALRATPFLDKGCFFIFLLNAHLSVSRSGVGGL